MRRWLWVVLALSVVATTCGGTVEVADIALDGDVAVGTVGDGGIDAEAAAAVAALVDDYGGDGAFAVGVFAFERGYGFDQVIAGAIDRGIQRDGSIDGVAPEGEPLGLVLIDPNSVLFVSFNLQDRPRIPIERFRSAMANALAKSSDRETTKVELIGGLLITTILEAFEKVDGTRYEPGDVIGSFILGITIDEYISLGATPATNPTAGSGSDVASIESEERLDSAAIFAGIVGIVISDPTRTVTCEGDIPIRIDITPDQAVLIQYVLVTSVGLPEGESLGEGDPTQYLDCVEGDRRVTHRGEIDAAAGTIGRFELPPPTTASLQVDVDDSMVASIKGTLDADNFLNFWTIEIDLIECTSEDNHPTRPKCAKLDELEQLQGGS